MCRTPWKAALLFNALGKMVEKWGVWGRGSGVQFQALKASGNVTRAPDTWLWRSAWTIELMSIYVAKDDLNVERRMHVLAVTHASLCEKMFQ